MAWVRWVTRSKQSVLVVAKERIGAGAQFQCAAILADAGEAGFDLLAAASPREPARRLRAGFGTQHDRQVPAEALVLDPEGTRTLAEYPLIRSAAAFQEMM